MVTSQAKLLNQLHEYVDEYVNYLSICSDSSCDDVNADLRRIIAELEELQAHPDQKAQTDKIAQRVSDQIEHLRMLKDLSSRTRRSAPTSKPRRTLADAFKQYLAEEVDYLTRVGGSARRDQTNVLLGDIIGDLKALALHPSDEQSMMIAADLERKSAQVQKLQRPWQQMNSRS